MVAFLGYLNVIILIIIFMPFLIKKINKYGPWKNSGNLEKIAKKIQKMHKVMGGLLFTSASVHGYLALKPIRIHTGTILFSVLFIQIILGIILSKKRGKALRKVHIFFGIIILIAVYFHLFQRNII